MRARDLANLLACPIFVQAYKTLVTPHATHALHRLTIAVTTDNNAVSFHTTATYTDIEAPIGITRWVQVVDLAVKVSSRPSTLGDVGRLEAGVTTAAVQLPPTPSAKS